MINRILFLSILLFLISCSQKDKITQPLFEKGSPKELSFSGTLHRSSQRNTVASEITSLKDLSMFQKQYLEKGLDFNLEDFKKSWEMVQTKVDVNGLSVENANRYFEASGLLLQLTGETIYADELEKVAFSGIVEEEKVLPYVFTKNLDNLFTNIYSPAIIEYSHTTGGEVKVEMVTDYPESGKVELRFNMTDRRYIEVNIKIPDWAEDASVTVKKVKYVAAPGTYCKIAKKWIEGDIVEIQFPKERIPSLLK